jgi:hypothetical protein
MFVVLSAFLLSAAAPDVQPVAGSTPAQPPVAATKPKKICRAEVGTGSILPKRTCLTQAEWDARARATEGDAEALRRAQGSRMPGSMSN